LHQNQHAAMDFSFMNILNVLGSLGLFIYGLKVMSDGIQRAAGEALRGFLNKMTSSKLLALFTGFFITSLIQSSSAATVLTVGLVNASLLTLQQSVGVIFGINIGTTVTGWIISVLGIKLTSYQTVLPLLIFVIPLLFSKKKNLNAWGDFLMGFILLLIGLFFMRDNVPNFSALSSDLSFLENLASHGLLSTVLFVIFGYLVTVVLQSSTATMALTIVICNKGWLPYEIAAGVILGSNIGTTSTAEIAALIASTSARRSARIHTFFNLYGSVWAVILLPFLLKLSDWIGVHLFYENSAFSNVTSIPFALAIFHTLFNLFNVVLFSFFPGVLIFSAEKTIKAKKTPIDPDEMSKPLKDTFNLPELNILTAQSEVIKLASVTRRMNQLLTKMLNEIDEEAQSNAFQLIRKNEEKIDRFQRGITNYLSEVGSLELTPKTSHRVSALMSICNELERIGDLYVDIGKLLKEKNEQKIWFNPQQRSQLQSMLFILERQQSLIIDSLANQTTHISVKEEINQLHHELRDLIQIADKSSEDQNETHKKSYKITSAIFQISDNISDHIYSIGRAMDQRKF